MSDDDNSGLSETARLIMGTNMATAYILGRLHGAHAALKTTVGANSLHHAATILDDAYFTIVSMTTDHPWIIEKLAPTMIKLFMAIGGEKWAEVMKIQQQFDDRFAKLESGQETTYEPYEKPAPVVTPSKTDTVVTKPTKKFDIN